MNDPQNHSGFSQVLEELPTVGGTPARNYVIGNEVLAQSVSGTLSYFLKDGHGNNRQLASASGTESGHYGYDAYGVVQSGISSTTAEAAPTTMLYGNLLTSNAAPQTAYLYTGQRFDADLQQYYAVLTDGSVVHVCWMDCRHNKLRFNIDGPPVENDDIYYSHRKDSDSDWSNEVLLSKGIEYCYSPTLTYDLQQTSGIETHDWVTMGSVLKKSTPKPVGVTGNWINFSSRSDPAYYAALYPPFPDNILSLSSLGPNVHSDRNVDFQIDMTYICIALCPVVAVSVLQPACASKKVIIMETGMSSSTMRIVIFLSRKFTTHYSTIVKYTVNDFFL